MKTILLVDYNTQFRAGDEAPADLAAKLVKAGLAKVQYAPKKIKSDEDE